MQRVVCGTKARRELFNKAVRLLAAHPAFSCVKEEALRCILASENTVLRDFPKGRQVSPCHGISKAVGIVLTGGCHLLEGGRITASRTDGFVFATEAESFTLSASQDTKVVFIKKSAIDRLLQDDFSVSERFLEFPCKKETAEKKEKGLGSDAESRLAAYLLNRPKNSKNEVSLPQDMLRVAKSLSLTKDGLYKAIEALNASGAIGFSGTAVCITDEALLRKFIK